MRLLIWNGKLLPWTIRIVIVLFSFLVTGRCKSVLTFVYAGIGWRSFWSAAAWRPPGKLLGLQRFEGIPCYPSLHEDPPLRLLPGTHPQSSGSERDAAQRPPRLQRLRKNKLLRMARTCVDEERLIGNRLCFQGLDDERQERGDLLGSYTYDQDGQAVQTFPIAVSNHSFHFTKPGTFLWVNTVHIVSATCGKVKSFHTS